MKFMTVLFLAFGLTSCFPNYSNGTRVGVVTKLSERGYFFKSWEGEMLMALPSNVSAMNAENFRFSVSPEAVEKVQKAMRDGKRVELQYHQWGMKPPTIDTPYVVTDVVAAE